VALDVEELKILKKKRRFGSEQLRPTLQASLGSVYWKVRGNPIDVCGSL
jgi:hypothetical protein